MQVESARHLPSGSIEAVIDGVPIVVPDDPGNRHRAAFDEWLSQGGEIAPVPREDLRNMAMARVDAEHADYLVMLTGGATVAERDTWKVKEEAARAFEAGTATPGQTAMLAAEAQGAGITEAELAATIIAKADAFLALVGVAAGLRAKGRAAIMAATDEAVPLDQVETQIDVVFAQLAQEVQAAITQIQTANAQQTGGNHA
jgi:hypothetical protein